MKAFITVLVLAVIVVGIVVLTKKNNQATLEVVNPAPTEESSVPNDTTGISGSTSVNVTTTAPQPTTHTVTYTSAGFSPSMLTIKVGDTVTFVNNTSSSMWVASDPHPAHTDYSAFDARKGYAPGESYSFTFTEPKTYGYHDHLHAFMRGTIVVQ